MYFPFLKFSNNGLRDSLTNCWFDIISLLIADLPHVAKVSDRAHMTFIYQKIYKPLQQDLFIIYHTLDFYQK